MATTLQPPTPQQQRNPRILPPPSPAVPRVTRVKIDDPVWLGFLFFWGFALGAIALAVIVFIFFFLGSAMGLYARGALTIH